MMPQHPDDIADEMGDGYGSNQFARAHAAATIEATANGEIGGKQAAIDKAKQFTKNGLSVVLCGSPRYSNMDAVMGYKWSIIFVGNEEAVDKFLDRDDDDDCWIKVIKP